MMKTIFCSTVSYPSNGSMILITRQISVMQYLTQIILIIYNNTNNEADFCSAVSHSDNSDIIIIMRRICVAQYLTQIIVI